MRLSTGGNPRDLRGAGTFLLQYDTSTTTILLAQEFLPFRCTPPLVVSSSCASVQILRPSRNPPNPPPPPPPLSMAARTAAPRAQRRGAHRAPPKRAVHGTCNTAPHAPKQPPPTPPPPPRAASVRRGGRGSAAPKPTHPGRRLRPCPSSLCPRRHQSSHSVRRTRARLCCRSAVGVGTWGDNQPT